MPRLARTGHIGFRWKRTPFPQRPESLRRRFIRIRSGAAWVAIFGFFSIWVAIALAPLLRFRVAPEKSLPAAVKNLEDIALDVARNSPVGQPDI